MKFYLKKFLFYLAVIIMAYSCQDQQSVAQAKEQKLKDAFLRNQSAWVDSMYQQMSLEEKIGQLFMVNAYSGGPNRNDTLIEALIRNNAIGGIIFMQGTAESQALLTHRYHSISKIPLLIGMDAEWGLGMRLTGVKNLPRQMMLGATQDPALAYELGKIVAEQCKLLGVHFNFAPVVDVNNNPNNPVINFRSFGQDKSLVAQLGTAYMKGMQDNGILASAKHFPGHGDVDIDSHLDLPIIHKSIEELKALELYPFQQLIDSGIASVMVAHLSVPALDSRKNTPTTLSYSTITELLKNSMHFEGLIITDALNMEGVTKYFPEGEVELEAFKAGNDILLFSKNVPLGVQTIKTAFMKGEISEERLAHSVKKILKNKYNVGLNTLPTLIDTTALTDKINKDIPNYNLKVAKAGLTLYAASTGKAATLDLFTNTENVHYLPINGTSPEFEKMIKPILNQGKIINANAKIDDNDWLIVGVHGISLYPGKDGNYGITLDNQKLINQYKDRKKTIFVFFGNPYSLRFLTNAQNVLIAYEENEYTMQAVIDVLINKTSITGKIPVTIQ